MEKNVAGEGVRGLRRLTRVPIWIVLVGLLAATAELAVGAPSPYTFQQIRQAVVAGQTTDTNEASSTGADVAFRDVPADGGILVGFTVTYVEFAGQQLIKTVQPMYLTASGSVPGIVHGHRGPKGGLVMAKDGYAVGAMTVHCGLFINGFKVTFMKIEGTALNPKDSYTAEWTGYQGGAGGDTTLDSKGALVVGIFGKVTKDKTPDRFDARSLGLILLPAKR